jgi:hypothetical protein
MIYNVIAFLIGITLVGFSGTPIRTTREIKTLVSPPKDLKYFVLGYNDSVADSLWLRVIQDIDICEKNGSSAQGAPSFTSKAEPGKCEKGWVFTMLDAITQLAPKFRIVYAAGGVLLSVVVQDTEGARIIFDRGLENFPHDWPLEYKAAYHYMDNVKDLKKAADLMVSAAKDGAPSWTYSLAAHLYTKEGQAFLAKSMLEDLLQNHPDERYNKKLEIRLQEANEVLAKAQPKQ